MFLKHLITINILNIYMGMVVYVMTTTINTQYERNMFLNGDYKNGLNEYYKNNDHHYNNNKNNITLRNDGLTLTSLLNKRATPFVGDMYLPTLLECRDSQQHCIPKAKCRDGYFTEPLTKPIQNCVPEENVCCIYKPPPSPITTTIATTTSPFAVCPPNTACVSQRDCRNGEILSQTVINLQMQKCYQPKLCCNLPSTMLTEDGYVLKTPPKPFSYPSYKPTATSGITTNTISDSVNNQYLPPVQSTVSIGGIGRQPAQQPQPQTPYQRPTQPQQQPQTPYQQPTQPQQPQTAYQRPTQPQQPQTSYQRPTQPQQPQTPYQRPTQPQQSQTPYYQPTQQPQQPQRPQQPQQRPQTPYRQPTQQPGQQQSQTPYRQPTGTTKQPLGPQRGEGVLGPDRGGQRQFPSQPSFTTTSGQQPSFQRTPQTPSRQPFSTSGGSRTPTISTPAYLPPTRRQRPVQPQVNEISKDRPGQSLTTQKMMVLRGEDQLSPQIFPTPRDRFNNQIPDLTGPALSPTPVKCASALVCTAENYCSSIGVISETPVELTSFRVPLTDCLIEGTGAPGKCCRDPNYVDPWPVNLAGVCAKRNKNTKPRGIKDIDANFAEIPWQAMILKESSKTLLCGGAIIGDGVVLTTASCVQGVPINDVRIKAGEWELGSTNEPLPFQLTGAKNIAIHPKYDANSGSNDMAVIHLTDRLQFASHIQPICINDKDPDSVETCITTGWGKQALSIHEEGAIMHVTTTSVLSRSECNADDSSICVATNFDTCQFDAGSALACGSGGNVQLKGIFSAENACGEGQAVRFTKPDIAWVNKQFLERSKPLLLKA